MIYKYVGYDVHGKKVEARIEASDLDEAKKKLKSKGVLYESVTESGDSFFKKLQFQRTHTLPAKRLAQFSKNIAIYLRSGIPIVNVIKLAKSQYEEDGVMVDFLSALETSMNEGNSYYHALDSQNIIELPSFYKQSIKVAEESGSMSEVLFEMARFVEEQDKVAGQVKQALIYPVIIVVISIFMVAFMLTTVVPKITTMFDQLKQELPDITKFVIALGDFLTAYWLFIAIAIMITSGLFSYFVKNSEAFKDYRYLVKSFRHLN